MLFFSPVTAKRAAVSSGVSKENLLLHLKAQRTIEFSPRANISAQSRAARMMTMLVSKLASLVYVPRVLLPLAGSGVVDDDDDDDDGPDGSRSRRCGR